MFPSKRLALLLLGSLSSGVCGLAAAQDAAPTFYADALPVFQKNCVACHQPEGPGSGGLFAPMSFPDYD